ncbi:hypothetical protein QJS66_22145 [Kocuria rhizophila]|nr:hypothetical protein QJS66_22145 [Kocuria rhizophila]
MNYRFARTRRWSRHSGTVREVFEGSRSSGQPLPAAQPTRPPGHRAVRGSDGQTMPKLQRRTSPGSPERGARRELARDALLAHTGRSARDRRRRCARVHRALSQSLS